MTLASHASAQRRPRPNTPPASTPEATPPPATPAPTAEDESDALARNHFESGRAYFAQAQYDDAAREFREAYRMSHRLPLLLNLARALEEGDHPEEAVAVLDEWLSLSPANDPGRTEATERRTRLMHEAELVAAANAHSEARSSEHGDSGRSPLFAVGLASVGVGVAAAATAIGTGVRAHGIHQDLEQICDPNGLCPASAASDIARGQALARASTAMTFIGVAAAGAGVALVFVGRGPHGTETTTTLAPTVAPTAFGATLRTSF